MVGILVSFSDGLFLGGYVSFREGIPFLVENPYKPSFVTVTGWGVDPMDTLVQTIMFSIYLRCQGSIWLECGRLEGKNAHFAPKEMGVSKNNGTPKSSILIGFSFINHPIWGTPIFGNIQIENASQMKIHGLFLFNTVSNGYAMVKI